VLSRFLTPSTLPSLRQCRSITIPDSLEWSGVVNAALLLLSDPYSWQQINDTDMTVDECAEIGRQMYEAYLISVVAGDCGGNQNVFESWRAYKVLAASAGAGNVAADTVYDREYSVMSTPPAWCTAGENQAEFTLGAGTYRVDMWAVNRSTNRSEIGLRDTTVDLGYWVTGTQQVGELVQTSGMITLTEAVEFTCAQWFQVAQTNGLGLASSLRTATVFKVMVTRMAD